MLAGITKNPAVTTQARQRDGPMLLHWQIWRFYTSPRWWLSTSPINPTLHIKITLQFNHKSLNIILYKSTKSTMFWSHNLQCWSLASQTSCQNHRHFVNTGPLNHVTTSDQSQASNLHLDHTAPDSPCKDMRDWPVNLHRLNAPSNWADSLNGQPYDNNKKGITKNPAVTTQARQRDGPMLLHWQIWRFYTSPRWWLSTSPINPTLHIKITLQFNHKSLNIILYKSTKSTIFWSHNLQCWSLASQTSCQNHRHFVNTGPLNHVITSDQSQASNLHLDHAAPDSTCKDMRDWPVNLHRLNAPSNWADSLNGQPHDNNKKNHGLLQWVGLSLIITLVQHKKSPVRQQNTWFDTKKPGSTQKCPVWHKMPSPACVSWHCHYQTHPLLWEILFYNFIPISVSQNQ